ncbi:InlB B-repeat-containing protein [Candidatus Saccharibacteria bacterium]|nr:InlB B-repeat-containing protein [Candidatus Saccharibacteria bacterium]
MTIEAEDLNLYAKWNVNKYTISYDLNGADGYIPPEIIEYGTPVSAPATPSRVGYTFLGWKDSNGEYEFTTMPAHNVELFADWQVNQYTVTFDADNGTTPTSLTGDYDTDFIAPAPEKTGYTFLGWYLKENPSLPFPYETFIASDLNLIAKWRINQYTISFDTDGGSEIPSITADYGTPVSAPAAPVKEGYTFLGWYLDGIRLNINDSLTIPAKNLTLIAHWSKNEPAIPAPVDPSPNIPSENNTPVANDDVTTPSSEDSLPSSESSTYYNGSTATRSASPNNSSATSNSSSDKTPDSSANPSHPADNTVPTNSPVSSITPSKVSPLGVATDSNSNSENTFLGTVWDIVRTISPFACLLMLFFIPLLVFKRHEDEAKRKVNKDK